MNIAISGCGITGMAAALLLTREGHAVTVFERAPAPEPTGSGLLLQPPGLMVLEQLGLLDTILAHGTPVRRLVGFTRGGRRVMNIEYEKWMPRWYGLGVHRGALWRVLHDAVRLANIRIVAGQEIDLVRDSRDQCEIVNARGEVVGGFDLVLAADGARSALRRQFADASREYPWGALWTNLRSPEGWAMDVLQQRYHRAQQMMGVLPVGRDAQGGGPWVTMFWSEPGSRLEDVRANVPAWRDAAQTLWPEAAPLLAQVSEPQQLLMARYMDVRPAHWLRGRLLLIGDAAHGTSPQLGQGATLGLLDAMQLCHSLRRGGALYNCLQHFVASRRAHVRYYQWSSRLLTPFFQSDSTALSALRDLAFGMMGDLPVVGREYLATLVGAKSGILLGRLQQDWQSPQRFIERS